MYGKQQHSIYCNPSSGPIFGKLSESDIHIKDQSNKKNNSMSYIGKIYNNKEYKDK